MNKNYASAANSMESFLRFGTENDRLKPHEVSEGVLFMTRIKLKQGKNAAALKYLQKNEKKVLDQVKRA